MAICNAYSEYLAWRRSPEQANEFSVSSRKQAVVLLFPRPALSIHIIRLRPFFLRTNQSKKQGLVNLHKQLGCLLRTTDVLRAGCLPTCRTWALLFGILYVWSRFWKSRHKVCGDAIFIQEGWYIFLNYFVFYSILFVSISTFDGQIGATTDSMPSLTSVLKLFLILIFLLYQSELQKS